MVRGPNAAHLQFNASGQTILQNLVLSIQFLLFLLVSTYLFILTSSFYAKVFQRVNKINQ